MMDLTENDLQQLSEKGISKEQLEKQIEIFTSGIPFIRLVKPALVDDGIMKYNPAREKELIQTFESSRPGLELLKFVPASGAASRMFKSLFGFLEKYDPEREPLQTYLDRNRDTDMQVFVNRLRELPFFELVHERIKGRADSRDKEAYLFVEEMLSEERLNYGFYPKGLLPFHRYDTFVATPFEEHLKEAAAYASVDGRARLHFTISEQHGELFNETFNSIKDRVTKATRTSYEVSYSFQKSATDTIAVTPENKPFRQADGSLLFRPGGHGALIGNLDEQQADIIFIKNIDNVVGPSHAETVAQSKKVLAGCLLTLQHKAHAYAAMLESEQLTGEQLQQIRHFLETDLNVRLSDTFNSFSIGQQIEILKDKINRPIRVCGMVKNEGEPGGGPYWVRDRNGNVSLQIVESAQVDMNDENQLTIFKEATHFNPVDIVCGVKNHKGEKYQLQNFVDSSQGFITSKTQEGKPLKALELPGLWNGGMAFWNTVFVEVPLQTFNPVKTVNDLLKPAHQV